MDISYDNDLVVYGHVMGRGEYGVYIARVNGSEEPQFVMNLNPLANDPSDVRFSPDGTKLVMSRGTSDIFVLDIESKELRQITFTSGNASDPDWDPGGRFVVYQRPFRRYQSDSYGFYIVDTECMVEQRLTSQEVPVVGGDPRWSPDGKWIAFWGGVSVGSTSALHIQVVRPDGSEHLDLTTGNLMRNQYPTWINGGTSLLFLRRANTTHDHWVLSVDLESQTQQWPLDLSEFRSQWVISRDGRWFAFTGPDPSCQLGVIYLQSTTDETGRSLKQVTSPQMVHASSAFDSEVLKMSFLGDLD